MAGQQAQQLNREAKCFRAVCFVKDFSCVIGRSPDADVRYDAPEVSGGHARLSLLGDTFTLEDLGSTNGTLVNCHPLPAKSPRRLAVGDVVQIASFTCMVGHGYLVANCAESVPLEASISGAALIEHARLKEGSPDPVEPTGEERLFYPAPRLMHSVHKRAFTVDSPPQGKKRDEAPAIMKLGPSFIMGLTSVFMIASTVSRLAGGADVMTTLPMLAMSISMIAGMLIWPLISKRYERKRDEREEARRESTYTDYLNAIEHALQQECAVQAGVLAENRATVPALLDRAAALSPELMNRTSAHSDFMDLRVGTGSLPLEADIRWPAEQFAVDRDRLLAKVIEVSHRPPQLVGVPLAFNPAEHYVAGIVGPRAEAWAFARGLVVQLCALMSYQDVKLMLVADEAEEAEWGCMRTLPHLFDDAGRGRFLATTSEELMGLTMHLERELERRASQRGEEAIDAGPRYVVLCANKALTDPSETIARLARLRGYRGISLVFMGEELKDLPRECAYVIDLTGTIAAGAASSEAPAGACMFDRADVSGTMLPFAPDIEVSPEHADAFARCMARVRLDVPGQRTALPSSLGFLEMFEAGNVSQLNIASRWAGADASRALQAPVGVDAQGEPAVLNLHEKVHGPHGLIAGTTGSGKSEFIITYVLSLAVCYPPDQVAFVLIDYKGGGLAGAFDNDRFRLPHLAGTITNLDGAAISRSLVSIKSELKRRQDAFNRAREVTGEATMDIYKYISYYLRGVLEDPIPHLFIVADEFAELKQQQPEFMDELMSAARIGRSLGVHLILATQKPSGVVNDQIRSNMRFKVCLKVADAGDSKEMIGRTDAAEIREPGRFYLLVGFSEYFTGGQAAYAGAPYSPAGRFEPKRDDAVELIDNAGATAAAIRPARGGAQSGVSEINAALGIIQDAAARKGLAANQLWLEPLSDYVALHELYERYGTLPTDERKRDLSLLVGELDDPANQTKLPLLASLQNDGNIALYGDASSGIEEVAASMLMNACERYVASELNVYALDFGGGMLTAFREAPQVGDVVIASDEERVRRLFRFLSQELDRRRRVLTSVGGSYTRYVAQGNVCPRVLLVINGMAIFNELYEKQEPQLVKLLREGASVGIHAILCATTVQDIRMRLRACVKSSLVFSLASEGDYMNLLGSLRGVALPDGLGRGLIRRGDGVYTFQSASVASRADEDSYRTIRAAIEGIGANSRGAFAPPIPVLPDRVTSALFERGQERLIVPIGMHEDSLDLCMFDYAERAMERVLYAKAKDGLAFLSAAVDFCVGKGAHRVILADFSGSLASMRKSATCELWNAETMLEKMSALFDGLDKATGETLLVISGIAALLTRSDPLKTRTIREKLQALTPGGRLNVLLFDAAVDATYSQEPWFKAQIGPKDALWVGEGLDAGQSAVQVSYAMGQRVDPEVKGDRGYMVECGRISSVKLIQLNERN